LNSSFGFDRITRLGTTDIGQNCREGISLALIASTHALAYA
jgi:hypothetical protein